MQQKIIGKDAVPDNIRALIDSMKQEGKRRIDMIDLMAEFSYSPPQIRRAMRKLVKEGVVKEE
ncbi:GntR family transcriptional regulator [Candidatus Woesearchaeota archaeon]|nr:GntR family transcriptional regulator [Candidatus Woesearchaeota archaeon]